MRNRQQIGAVHAAGIRDDERSVGVELSSEIFEFDAHCFSPRRTWRFMNQEKRKAGRRSR
jgi:hypothetical protein